MGTFEDGNEFCKCDITRTLLFRFMWHVTLRFKHGHEHESWISYRISHRAFPNTNSTMLNDGAGSHRSFGVAGRLVSRCRPNTYKHNKIKLKERFLVEPSSSQSRYWWWWTQQSSPWGTQRIEWLTFPFDQSLRDGSTTSFELLRLTRPPQLSVMGIMDLIPQNRHSHQQLNNNSNCSISPNDCDKKSLELMMPYRWFRTMIRLVAPAL